MQYLYGFVHCRVCVSTNGSYAYLCVCVHVCLAYACVFVWKRTFMNVYVGSGCWSSLYTGLYKVQVFSVRPWFLSPYPKGFRRLTFLLDLSLCTVALGRLCTNLPTAVTNSQTTFTVHLQFYSTELYFTALQRCTFFFHKYSCNCLSVIKCFLQPLP